MKSNTQAFPVDDSVKAQAVITWLGAGSGVSAKVRLYDRLFSDPNPDAGGKDFIEAPKAVQAA